MTALAQEPFGALTETPIERATVGWRDALRDNPWLIGLLLVALLLGELPLAIAGCCAPAGATGLGTTWFINDFAQYESAMRQGAEQPGWLVLDPFTSEPHQPALMFPLYVAIGKLGAATHVSAEMLERVLEVFARAAVVVALWYFAKVFTETRAAARWAVALALFGSGFEVVGALLSGYAGNWSYETNGFGLLFAAPHVPLAMAATLVLAARGLMPHQRGAWDTAAAAALSAAIALLHPFHLPVLLGALLITGLVFWASGRGAGNLVAALAACAAALPVLAPTVTTFSFDPFWLATYSSQNQLPSPLPHELFVELGVTLLLALGGAVFLQGRVAPFGLLVWLLLSLVAMYLPVPYQRRLGFGIEPALAVLAANTLVAWTSSLTRRNAAALRLGVVAAAASGTAVILASTLASGFRNAPLPVYRSTADLDRAAAWLDSNAEASDLILADWATSNYLAGQTRGRLYGGHPVATLHADEKRFVVASVFAHPSSQAVARSLGAQWLVYGPDEAGLQVRGSIPPAFQSGSVRVYRVDGG